jgi:uncharacterized protein YbaP (TraB family)
MLLGQCLRGCVIGAVLSIAGATAAVAACQGTDIRDTFSPATTQSIAQAVAATPFPSGNHWRATRDGKTLHLIGTIHLDDPRLVAIAERLTGIIETSDMLLLEVSPDEEAALKRDMLERPELLFLQEGTLPELLPEEDWARLRSAFEERGVAGVIASRFQPWYAATLLGIPACLIGVMADEGHLGLDNRLRDIALAGNVPMRGLEPHDTFFHLFTDDPMDAQLDIMMLTLNSEDTGLDLFAAVIDAFFAEKHAEAWEVSRYVSLQTKGETPERLDALFAAWETDLLATRNHSWMPVILEALTTRTQVTVAAGAAHLSGDDGLLTLLQAEGFELERLPF